MNTVLKKTTSLVLIAFLVLGISFAGSDTSYAKRRGKKPAKVASLKVKASKAKISLSWKKAKNAKKYQVYMKTDSGKWKKYKTVTKNKLTYTAKENATFSFKVRGINGKRKGRFSKTGKITISCVPAIKLSTKNIEVEKGDSFTVKVSGCAASTATWNFDTSFLKANTKAGDRKKFTAKEAGSTVITVTDENNENAKSVEVTIKEQNSKPSQDEAVFEADGPTEITVAEGEEFTLKIKGKYAKIACWSCDNTYINKTEEYDGWKNDDESILNSDCTPVCKFKAVCPGTTTIEARSKTAIGKRLKEVFFTVNVEGDIPQIDDISIINPRGYDIYSSECGFSPIGIPIFVKTSYLENSFSTAVVESTKEVNVGDYFSNIKMRFSGCTRRQVAYDDVNYIHTETIIPDESKSNQSRINVIDTAVNGGYVYTYEINQPGSYRICAYDSKTNKIIYVSELFTVKSYRELHDKTITDIIENSVRPGMSDEEKCDAIERYIDNTFKYPYICEHNSIKRYANKSLFGENHIALVYRAMYPLEALGVGDSGFGSLTLIDCCKKLGIPLEKAALHDVRIKGVDKRYSPCAQQWEGVIDCTKIEPIM